KGSEDIAHLEEERNRFLRFLSMAAHDLKAPLTAIQSFLWVILGGLAGEINDKQRHMLERSSLRIKELLDLISDLLDISRIESQRIVQELEEVYLHQVIGDCCDDLQNLAEEKGLKLELELPPDLPGIQGSEVQLKQVMTNLLNNAICYTPEGAITVRMQEMEKEVQVEVIDTGVGIPAGDVPMVFEEFFRAGNVETKGTGLGLSITKRIVEAHGGKIWAESPCFETNKGSKFTITLPKERQVQT
ncbi:sensor histidine kinase, partial [Chloroflexota bacterium]